jgi:hypothetical protein
MDCEQMYHREFSERERLHTALSTPIGLLSIVGALLGYMFQNVRGAWTIDAIAAYILVAAAAVAVVVAVINLFHSMHGHTYKGIESPTALRNYHQDLRQWHAKYGTGPLAGDREFEEYLQSAYATAANRNQEVNAYRSDNCMLQVAG